MHPGWVVLGTSLWVGAIGNARLWQVLFGGVSEGLAAHLFLSCFIASASAALLSLRFKSLKQTASVLLVLAALASGILWSGPLLTVITFELLAAGLGLVVEPALPPLLLLMQVLVAILVLAAPPMLWLWRTPLRRLASSEQRAARLIGASLAVVLLAISGFALRMAS